tara:strand:+ start:251 stop:682 length:432 start_codon:yes stop_codon:yes gene_type:complete
MLYKKFIFLHCLIGLYVFFLFGLNGKECTVSSGLYLYITNVYPAVRAYEDILHLTPKVKEDKYSIIFYIVSETVLTGYGVVEISRLCVNDMTMGWMIYNTANNFVFIFITFLLLRRKNRELSDIPLLASSPRDNDSPESFIDL